MRTTQATTKTSTLALVVVAALGLAMVGCSAPKNAGSANSSSSAVPGVAGGTLVVGLTADPSTLLPWTATQFQAVHVLENIYGTLTQFDKNLKVVPGIAENWTPSDNGKTLTIKLHHGVTFVDGSPCTAKDVKYSLDKIKDPATAAVARSSLANVTKVIVKDDDTVELTLSAPDAALPANLASVNMAILPANAALTTLKTTPDGTGPFDFDSRTPNQSITLKKNNSYWGDKAKLDGIEFRIIPDETSIVSAMQSGNVNMAVVNDPLVAKNASTTLAVARTAQLSYHALMLNSRKGALQNLDVRLAIQCGIDRQQVLDTAALGEGEVTGPITSPAFKSDPAARPCQHRDLDKAKQYLAKSGQTHVTIHTIVSQGEYSTSVNEAQNLKSQLADIGIDLDLEVLESGAYVTKWINADFEAAVALNGGRPDPDGMYGRYFASTGNLNKVAGYSSPALDKLLAEGKASQSDSQRQEIYKNVSNELENNAVWIWLFTGYTYTVTTPTVKGFQPMATGSLEYLRTTTIK